MASINITNQKFTPGPLPKVYAARAELLVLLSKAAEKKIVYVSAPAGSGKTVGALLWTEASGRKTIWIGLDALDNAASVFYRMFCTGILSAQPQNERGLELLNSRAFDASPIEHTINLLASFGDNGEEYALVLDDFHTVTNGEILKSLPLILRRLPSSFVTLILSRTEPAGLFADWIEEGKAEAIGSRELAFSEKEIGAYYRALNRDAGEAGDVFAYTNGLAIFVNALAQGPAILSRKYGMRVLDRYLRKYLWDEWDEERRAFMMASAAVDEMPITLCEKITGRADAGALLETLRADNVFVARVEDEVYRYHHLFLDFLRAQPEYERMDKTKGWRAAAEYYLDAKEYFVARSYAYRSGHIKTILSCLYALLQNRGISLDDHFEIESTLSTPEMEALCERYPVLYISRAWVAFMHGDAAAFERHVDKLKSNLPMILLKYPRFAETLLMMIVLDYRTPFATQIKQAGKLPPIKFAGEELRATTLSIQMPFMHRSCRDFYELADTRLHDGLKKTFGKLLKSHYEMIMYGVSSGLLLEQNRVSDALNEAQACVAMLNAETVREMRFAARMHLAAVFLAQGKEGELADCLKGTERFIDEDAGFLRPNYLAFTTRVKLWNGDASAAREWLDQYFVNDSATLEPYRIYQYFTTVRAYAALSELDKTRDLAERLRKMGQDFRRPQDAAEAGALLAAILWAKGQKKEAQETLEAVLLEIQPLGFVRLIADEGAAVLPILKKIKARVAHADYAAGLKENYVNNIYLAAYGVSKQRAGILIGARAKPVKLSKQQKVMLELLSQGYSRDGIVKETGLAVTTIKSHVKMLYEKLDVNSAADAVLRARELGIIE